MTIALKWKRDAQRRVRRMSVAQALATLDAMAERGPTIEHPEIRAITGGYASQAICGAVRRMLAVRAGILRSGGGWGANRDRNCKPNILGG